MPAKPAMCVAESTPVERYEENEYGLALFQLHCHEFDRYVGFTYSPWKSANWDAIAKMVGLRERPTLFIIYLASPTEDRVIVKLFNGQSEITEEMKLAAIEAPWPADASATLNFGKGLGCREVKRYEALDESHVDAIHTIIRKWSTQQ